MAGGILFQALQEGIYEVTVVISPFCLTRPYYQCLMQCPDWVTWWRSTSARHTPMSGLAQPCRLLPCCTNEYVTEELIWPWKAIRCCTLTLLLKLSSPWSPQTSWASFSPGSPQELERW